MKTTKPTNRRKFLVAASLGSAGAAAAIVTGAKATAESPSSPDAKPSGYHVTEHILKYYKTTEV
jgi:hypothetical protein